MDTKFLVVAILLSWIKLGNSNLCYECESRKQPQCGYRFNRTKIEIAKCEAPNTCKKILLATVGGGYEPIIRGCRDNTYCTFLNVCLECKDDLCNTSNNLQISLVIVFNLLILVRFF